MKKLLLSTLVAVMVLSFSSLAFAAAGTIAGPAFTDIAGHEAEADLTLLAALNVFTGDTGVGGTVRPDASITRAEFCKVVVTATGKGSTAAGLAGLKPTFKDEIPTWAWGYINTAVYMGVIQGYADGTFGASKNVTYGEAVTMLIRAVSGHNAQVPPGVWPYNYLFYGVDNDFVGSVDVGFANLPATRGDISSMLVATMGVDKLNKDGLVLADTSYFSPIRTIGIVTTFTLGDDSTIVVGGNVLPLAEKVYLAGASNYPGLLGLNVWAVANDDEEIVAVVVKQAANTVKGVFDQYLDENTLITGNDTYLLVDGTKIPIAFDTTGTTPVITTMVTVNGGDAGLETLARLTGGEECTFVLGSDGKASNVSALRFDLGKMFINGAITKSTATTETNVPTSVVTFEVEKTATITMNGSGLGRDSLAQWDVLQVATKLGNGSYVTDTNPIYAIRGARQAFEGTVKSYRTVTGSAGTVYYSTFELTDKSLKEYVVAVGAGGGNISSALTGGTGKFGFDAKGKVYVRISYETDTTSVLLVSKAISGSGGTTTETATVDMRGVERTFNSTYLPGTSVGKLGVMTINPDTNQLSAFAVWAVGGTAYDIVAVDAASGNITLQVDGGGAVAFVTDAVVYKFDQSDGTYTYVPVEQVGLWKTDLTLTNPTYVYISAPFICYSVP
jgi:hypothetical protein